MLSGWPYRVISTVGTALSTLAALLVANHPAAQWLFTSYVPLFWRLDPVVLGDERLRLAATLSVLAVCGSLIPLYKPRPRRILDTVALAGKRVVVAGLALATLGFFQWSHRLPRATLTMLIGLLLVGLPAWFVLIRRRPAGEAERALIVGDDFPQIERIVGETDLPLLGYLCPTSVFRTDDGRPPAAFADGGAPIRGLERLGGLSRLEDVLVERDVDTAVLAFREADREEFFGALDACYEHGVAAKVHREYADSVLVADDVGSSPLLNIEIEPWDVQGYVLKRTFDVAFAAAVLAVLSPVILLIVVAIRLEGVGPVFFDQTRTYLFGETFTIRKFRTLKPDPDNEVGTTIDDDRYTTLGRVLRTTHLDEIPQLWSILTGEMSVVGPRPAQTEIEDEFEAEATEWRRRWFVKPGLTGLAQINDVDSRNPREKIQHDLHYIRNQSFWFDLRIVARQLWKVARDVGMLVSDGAER
jgi:lipopolysaccharide/colanic/teichoic acid biosynthesis glycosyltransferase